jgi:hypothetical protein
VTATPARPRDVVLASALTIFGSVFALAGIFTAQEELNTAQLRREVETLLAEDPLSAVDISVDTVLTLAEVGLMGASVASVAAIVLAVFVLRRHNPSRIALTVLGGLAAATMLLPGLSGLVIAIFVVYTVSLLWRAPVRGWFAASAGPGSGSGSGSGEEEHPAHQPQQPEASAYPDPSQQPQPPGRYDPEASPEQPPGGEPGPTYPGAGPWSGQQPGQQPGPYTPHDQPATDQPAQPGQTSQPGYPPPYPQPYGYGYPQGYYGYPAVDPDRRPPQVVTAHVMTWVGAAFGLMTGVFFLAASGSQEILDVATTQLGTTDLTPEELATMLRVAGAVMALWSLAVAVVSVFSWRRANWAAILLTVMGVGYLLMQLVTLLSGQVAVLFAIVWVAAVVVLLWWPASRQWYAGRGRSRQQGPYGGQPGPYGGPPYPEERRRNQPW